MLYSLSKGEEKMLEKKRMKTSCACCNKEFSFFKEPKGVLLIPCPYCGCELKIVFEDDTTKILFKSIKMGD